MRPLITGLLSVALSALSLLPGTNGNTASVATPPLPLATRNMTCSPRVFGKATDVAIDLPATRGRQLAIVVPSGNYLFVSYDDNDPAATVKSPISTKDFLSAKRILMKSDAFMGVGEGAPTRVFVKAGEYTILVGDSLDTDAPNVSGWCKVKYKP